MALTRPRVATAAMFFVSGAVIGLWAANVPFVRERLGASTSLIGLCLLALAAGSVAAMVVVGRELDRRSSAALTRAGALVTPLVGVLPVLAPTPAALALALLALGLANGWLDVSMNAHGVAVERRARTPIMSSLHGGWSLGGLAGAGAVALGHVLGADPRAATAACCALLLALAAWLGRHLGDATVATGRAAPPPVAPEAGAERAPARGRLARPSAAVLLMGTLSAMLFVAEGAMTDWAALYLDDSLGAGRALAAAGFAGFAAGAAAGRLGGDALNARIGPTALLRWGTAASAGAIAVMLALGTPAVAMAALALAGLGLANGVPLLFSAAGRTREMTPGRAIATVSMMSYAGLLAGPPLLGFLADATSLPVALSTTAVLTAAVALLAGRAVGR